jgi:hypothetical protein
VAEAFDRAGLRLNSSGATTVYQAPTDPGAGTSLVLSLLAAHRSSNGPEASLEITIADAAGQTLATPVQRQAIGPGMAIELMPNRVVLLPGERLRAKSSPGGVVDLMASVLAPELLGNRKGIPSVEVYARYLPPETVGTDQNVVELPAAVAVNVNFEEPAVLTGFAVQVPPTGADVSFPGTVVLIQGIPFGAVTVEPAGLSLELQAEVPFIQAGSAPFFVPAAGIELAAAAPTVATGASVSPAAFAIEISAVAPDVVASSFDADAAAYIAAVEAADAQTLEPEVKTAYNDFVVGCKADGIWNAIKASCILAGARTLTGALTPLVGTAPTNFNFVSGDYNRKTGLVGDGSTKYLNSNRAGNADPQNSRHFAAYATTSLNGSLIEVLIGTNGLGTNGSSLIFSNEDNGLHFRSSQNDTPSPLSIANVSSSTGLIGANRSLSANFIGRCSGANTTFTSASETPDSQDYAVFARTVSAPARYATCRLAFYSIGESLDLALLDTRVSTLISAIDAAIS